MVPLLPRGRVRPGSRQTLVPCLCTARLAQHLSPTPQNLPIRCEGSHMLLKKAWLGKEKLEEPGSHVCSAPLSQYSAKCSSTSACKLDQGLQVQCIQKLKPSRKVKYLWVWTKGRALTHHLFNQLLAEQGDCKHRTFYKGQDLHLQKCR